MTTKNLLMTAPAAGGGGTPVIEATASGDTTAGTSQTVSTSVTVPSATDMVLYVALCATGNTSAHAATFDGVSMTAVSSAASGTTATNREVVVFRLVSPPVGTATATGTWVTNQNAVILAVVVSGVDQTTPDDTPSTAAATSGTSSSLSPTGAASDLVLSWLSSRTTATDDANTTLVIADSVSNLFASAGEGTTAAAVGWTFASDNYAHVAFAVIGA